MTAHEGINAHAASDLLRQAMLQRYDRLDDDGHDHIGSISTTPSGVATPRPDLSVDKRVPPLGITHQYFGQVRKVSFLTPSTQAGYPLSILVPDMEAGHYAPLPLRMRGRGGDALPTAPNSPRPQSADSADHDPPLLSHELPGEHQRTDKPEYEAEDAPPYPTPPSLSPTPSISSAQEGHFSFDSATRLRHAKPNLTRIHSSTDIMPLRMPRQAMGSNLLSEIITSLPVHAAHISNPTTSNCSPTPGTSVPDAHIISAHSSLTSSYLELVKLTGGAANLSRSKNTPPRTPRALSIDSSENGTKVPPSPSQRPQISPQPSSPSQLRHEHASAGATSSQPVSAAAPPVGPPKGKMTVRILEARGLRPSYSPYVVCVFEWNEYISKGPTQEGSVVEGGEAKSKDKSAGNGYVKRVGGEMGRSMAIPMKSRQSSTTSLSDHKDFKNSRQITDPTWDHEAMFDVLGRQPGLDIYIYDRSNQDAFLGHVTVFPNFSEDNSNLEGWFKLEARSADEDTVTGEIHLKLHFQKTDKKHFGPEDFEILKLIGKGTFGQVYQVRKKDTQRIYAMKVLSKKVIVQKKEVAHTLGERNILVRTAMADSPFIVGLKFSFQTPTDLYLVTGYMSGGELFWHLQKEGRFNEGRAKFYIAELILALQHLHQYDIVYRDLKPENILLDANGHIALCDFGLSKANLTKNATTNTFCGTTEYLAPEVLLDEQGYTTMVDFWSLGVLVFEMCCGWSPFYAEDTQQMYKNIAFGKVRFPRDALSTEGRNFVKGLLNRNPKHRLGATNDAEELKAHPFFADIDWTALAKKLVVPPFKPKLKSVLDTSNFDPEFTTALQNSSSLNARATALTNGLNPASTPLSPGMQANFKGFTYVDESAMEDQFRGHDLESMEEDANEVDDEGDDLMDGIVRTETEEGAFVGGHFDV